MVEIKMHNSQQDPSSASIPKSPPEASFPLPLGPFYYSAELPSLVLALPFAVSCAACRAAASASTSPLEPPGKGHHAQAWHLLAAAHRRGRQRFKRWGARQAPRAAAAPGQAGWQQPRCRPAARSSTSRSTCSTDLNHVL